MLGGSDPIGPSWSQKSLLGRICGRCRSLRVHLSSSSSIDCTLTFENENEDDDEAEDDLAYASSWAAGEARVRRQVNTRYGLVPIHRDCPVPFPPYRSAPGRLFFPSALPSAEGGWEKCCVKRWHPSAVCDFAFIT